MFNSFKMILPVNFVNIEKLYIVFNSHRKYLFSCQYVNSKGSDLLAQLEDIVRLLVLGCWC